jgi:hypothetical protein
MQDATSTISVRTFIYNEPLLPDELGASSRPAVAYAWCCVLRHGPYSTPMDMLHSLSLLKGTE